MSWARREVDASSEPVTDADLLSHLGVIHKEFLEMPRPRFFEHLLERLLLVTNSEYGFLGEVLNDKDGQPYLKTYALTNLGWNEATLTLFAEQAALGLEFRNLKTLFGRCLETAEIVIANVAEEDDRAGGIPEGHPPLNSFLGVPLHHGGVFIGMLGVANRPEGYDKILVERLEPVFIALSAVVRSHRAEQERDEAETSRARMASVVDSSSDFVGIADADLKLISLNAAGCALLGYADDSEIVGQHLSVTYPDWVGELIERVAIPHALANGSWIGDTALLNRDGIEIPISQLILVHYSGDGEVANYSTVARDIRVPREVERLKDELIATVSHEIRTPLTAIIGAISLIEDSETVDAPNASLIAMAQANARRLERLVAATLDFERLRHGNTVFRREQIRLEQIATDVIDEIAPIYRERGISFEIQTEPTPVSGDPLRLGQAISNLLVNAAEFSPNGATVRIEVRPEAGDAVVSVADDGPGIPSEFQETIFEPFVQADQSTTRSVGGTGLGLSIVRLIVDQHGGTVDVESTPGKGSTFRLRIPS